MSDCSSPSPSRDGSSSTAAATGSTWRTAGAGAPAQRRRIGPRRHARGGNGRRRHALRPRFSCESRRRKDAAAIDRRPAAEFQAHADLEHRDGGFVRNMKMPRTTVDTDCPRRGCTPAFAQATAPRPQLRLPPRRPRRLRRRRRTPTMSSGRRTCSTSGSTARTSCRARIRIDNDGSFPFEYLGRVKAEGMTTAQIEAYLVEGAGRWLSPQSAGVGRGGRIPQPERIRDRRSAIAEQIHAARQFDTDGRADAGRIGHAERRQLGADYARAPGRGSARARRHRPSTTCA